MNTLTDFYSFNKHKHHYALWTAARASQRSFTTTENICNAINATNLRQFAESEVALTQEQFDEQHTIWCGQIIESFGNMEITCTYGRAAKIIAIYLKTSVILPSQGVGVNALVIHPPIDRILLNNLCIRHGLKELASRNWTHLTREVYTEIVAIIRRKFNSFNWQLEKDWQANSTIKPDE